MNTRKILKHFMTTQYLEPTDLVTMVGEVSSNLDLIDLVKLLNIAEMEIQYRQEKGLLD